MRTKNFVLIAIFVASFQMVNGQCNCLIDDFSNASFSGGQVSSKSRYWYSFGGIQLNVVSRNLLVTGNVNSSAGFGIDPGTGTSGAPIVSKNCDSIQINVVGAASAVKLELYDKSYKSYDLWFDLDSTINVYTKPLPAQLKNAYITKLQFVLSVGDYNIKVKSIKLK